MWLGSWQVGFLPVCVSGEASWAEILLCHLWDPEKSREMDSGSKSGSQSLTVLVSSV